MTATESVRVRTEEDRIEEVIRYNIRRYLRLLGRSQNSLAPEMGVTSGSISQMMTGFTVLKFRQVYKVAKALGVTIDDLMDDTYIRQDEEFMEKMRDNTASTKNIPAEREDPASLAGAGSKRYVLDFDESGKKGTDQRGSSGMSLTDKNQKWARISGRRTRPRTGC